MITADNNVEQLISNHNAANKKIILLKRMQMSFIIICIASLISGFTFKVISLYTHLIIPFGLVGIIFGIFTWTTGRMLLNTLEKFKEYDESLKKIASFPHSRHNASSLAIPLTIGFANFLGEDAEDLISDDNASFSSLFARTTIGEFQQLPSADVLFIYGHLNEEGNFSDLIPSSIGHIVEQTNAAIVVVASPNSVERITNAAKASTPKTANIVYTLNRNGDGFGRFFQELFEKMRNGKDMLTAWVELAPQNPRAQPSYVPQTIQMSGAGKIAFPRQ